MKLRWPLLFFLLLLLALDPRFEGLKSHYLKAQNYTDPQSTEVERALSTPPLKGERVFTGEVERVVNLSTGSVDLLVHVENYSFMNLTVSSSTPVNVSIENMETRQSYPLASDVQYFNVGFQINVGEFSILLSSAKGGGNAYVTYTLTPIFALPSPSLRTDYPVGLVYYGLCNCSGGLRAEPLSVEGIMGVALIKSIGAYTPVGLGRVYGASIQLNSLLEVITQQGKTQFLWLQMSTKFLMNLSVVEFSDIVWNFTKPYSSISQLNGSGGIEGSSVGDVYVYQSGSFHYTLPMLVKMKEVVSLDNSTGHPRISFLYYLKFFGSPFEPQFFSDNVTIGVDAEEARIVANPFFKTQGGVSGYLYPDVEFVVAGIGNGYTGHFYSLNAVLGLYYLNGSEVKEIPSMFSYGADTAEGALNAELTVKGGLPTLTIGAGKAVWITTDPSLSYFDSYDYINYLYLIAGYVPYAVIAALVGIYIYRKVRHYWYFKW
jgi:thermopsin